MEENQPTVDRSLFVPLAIGVFAIVGICLLLLALRLGSGRGNVQAVPTATAVKFLFLGTEPGIVEPTDLVLPTETATMEATPTEFFLPTRAVSPTASYVSQSTVIVLPGASTNTPVTSGTIPTVTRVTATATRPTATATDLTATIAPYLTYDDIDASLTYTGNWVSQSGLLNVYNNTLHISNTIGDALQITFYGDQFQFKYQSGPTLGAIVIHVDTLDFVVDQSASTTTDVDWQSPILATAYHTVTITHISGGSITFDAVTLFIAPTPTPTMTPTLTRTVGP